MLEQRSGPGRVENHTGRSKDSGSPKGPAGRSGGGPRGSTRTGAKTAKGRDTQACDINASGARSGTGRTGSAGNSNSPFGTRSDSGSRTCAAGSAAATASGPRFGDT